MINSANKTTSKPERNVLHRRIGSTLYRVGIEFSPNARESLDEKILRLLKNDLRPLGGNVTMEPLQAGWLPERGSL